MKVGGSARTPYAFPRSSFGSSATGKLSLCFARYGLTTFGSASTETATSTKPCSFWRCQSRPIAGLSSRHRGDHAGRESTRTTPPGRAAGGGRAPPPTARPQYPPGLGRGLRARARTLPPPAAPPTRATDAREHGGGGDHDEGLRRAGSGVGGIHHVWNTESIPRHSVNAREALVIVGGLR